MRAQGAILGRWSGPGPLAAALCTGLSLATPAHAGATPWFSIGALAGATLPDGDLADYQWQVTPRAAWGAEALAGHGPLSAGLRFWTSATEQRLGSGSAESATVTSSSWEVIGRGRIARFLGTDLVAMASAGRLHLGYSPDQVSISTGGGPVTVDLKPIDEWIGGGGLAAEKSFAKSWMAGLEIESRFFGLDASHREGSTIVTQRETFGDLSARIHVARRFGH